MQEENGVSLAGLTGSVDWKMVAHGAAIVLIVLVLYHFLFHR